MSPIQKINEIIQLLNKSEVFPDNIKEQLSWKVINKGNNIRFVKKNTESLPTRKEVSVAVPSFINPDWFEYTVIEVSSNTEKIADDVIQDLRGFNGVKKLIGFVVKHLLNK